MSIESKDIEKIISGIVGVEIIGAAILDLLNKSFDGVELYVPTRRREIHHNNSD